MHRTRLRTAAILLVLTLVLSACAVPAATLPAASGTDPVEAETALEVVGLTESVTLTLADLEAMAASEGMAGTKSSTGQITVPALWTGVSLVDVAALVDGFGPETALSVEAKDGYAMTLSYDQVMHGDFIAYDPGTGSELESFQGPLTVIVAYARDGEPLDAEAEGPLRLALISAEGNQVTDGHWAVKWVRRVTVKPAAEEWVLQLEGAVSESMDRGTFESGAASGCHGAGWTDEGGQVWTGMPLWRLVGRVDDEIVHEGPAYNDELARVGYAIDVVSADGYTVTLASDRVDRNDALIVAYLVDGNPLPEKYFPLRLVGGDLEKSEMVGGIATIVVNLPEAAPTAAAEQAALTVTGMVDGPLALTAADLAAMEQVTITAKHPKKDEAADYTGVRLNAILDGAAARADATTLVLTASDGYSTLADLAAVQACSDCLVVSDAEDGLRLVMPDMDSALWVKGLVLIQLVSGGVPAPDTEEEAVEPDEPVEVSGDLTVTGLVTNPAGFTREALVAAATTEMTATHPKLGEMEYAGILLGELLEQVSPVAEATMLAITASDGYTVEVRITDVLACPESLLAVDGEGIASTVFPDMESGLWVKDVVSIEVK